MNLAMKLSTQSLDNSHIWDTFRELLNHVHRGCAAWLRCCLLIAREVNDAQRQISVKLWKVQAHSVTVKTILKKQHLISAARNTSYLQIIFPVDDESVAEHVSHDDQVRVLALHRNTVHAQKLREECTAMTLHNMLQNTRNNISWASPIKSDTVKMYSIKHSL